MGERFAVDDHPDFWPQKGEMVSIVRGRTNRGVIGTVVWVGYSKKHPEWGPRVGIQPAAGGETIFTSIRNVNAPDAQSRWRLNRPYNPHQSSDPVKADREDYASGIKAAENAAWREKMARMAGGIDEADPRLRGILPSAFPRNPPKYNTLPVSDAYFGRQCPHCGKMQESWSSEDDAEGFPVYFYQCECGYKWAWPKHLG